MFDRTTPVFFSFSVGLFFLLFRNSSPFLLASLFSGFPQKLIDLDHGLFGSFSAAISGDLSLYSISLSFVATAGVMCRFIRLLVVVVDLSWYVCMYSGCMDKWVGGVCVMSE